MDLLLDRWREHLSGLPEAAAADTAAMIAWPSREASGVRALLGHGMQPIEVIAARLPAAPPRHPMFPVS